MVPVGVGVGPGGGGFGEGGGVEGGGPETPPPLTSNWAVAENALSVAPERARTRQE